MLVNVSISRISLRHVSIFNPLHRAGHHHPHHSRHRLHFRNRFQSATTHAASSPLASPGVVQSLVEASRCKLRTLQFPCVYGETYSASFLWLLLDCLISGGTKGEEVSSRLF
jgi:hypothetical protein